MSRATFTGTEGAYAECNFLTAPAMDPKVEACGRFVTATGQVATIGALTEAHAVLEGKVGTTMSMVASDPAPPTSLLGTPR